MPIYKILYINSKRLSIRLLSFNHLFYGKIIYPFTDTTLGYNVIRYWHIEKLM